jgi:hypothetical protein
MVNYTHLYRYEWESEMREEKKSDSWPNTLFDNGISKYIDISNDRQ